MNSVELIAIMSSQFFVQLCQVDSLGVGYYEGIYTNKISKHYKSWLIFIGKPIVKHLPS